MAVGKVFTVLTEFRFEAGQAIATSGALQGAVGGITDSANQALFSMQRLGLGIAAQFGLGTTGVAGVLFSAVKASDKFLQSQIKIANLLQSAGFFQGPQGFEDAMLTSEKSLIRMRDIARKFALPTEPFVQTTTLIGASLLSKGLDDQSLKRSTEISRQFLKSAPLLGVDPSLGISQIIGAISGRAELGGTTIQRLLDETRTLKAFSGKGGLQQFNALDATRRLDLLTRALAEFGNNTKAASAIANSFSGQMRLLGENLTSMFSVLRRFGGVLTTPLVGVLQRANSVLTNEFEKVMDNIAEVIEPLIRDPKALLTNLLQVKNLRQDVGAAGRALGVGGILLGIGEALKFLGVTARFANPLVAGVGISFSVLAESMSRAFPVLGKFIDIFGTFAMVAIVLGAILHKFGILGAALSMMGRVFVALVPLISRVLVPLGLLIGAFQVLSRAQAVAAIQDAEALPGIMVRLSETLKHFSKIWNIVTEPVAAAINSIANAIAPIFRITFWAELLADTFEFITNTFVLFVASFQGIMFTILQILDNVRNLVTGKGGLNIFKGAGDAFDAGTDDIFEKVFGKSDDEEKIVAQRNVNIGKVEINNAFKEQAEPDRIAFTIQDQLMKAALNKGQANGRSLGSGFVSQ